MKNYANHFIGIALSEIERRIDTNIDVFYRYYTAMTRNAPMNNYFGFIIISVYYS